MISLGPLYQTVVEGGSFTLSCKAEGDGILQFTWLLAEKDKVINPGVSGHRRRSFPGGSNVTFSNVVTSDSGTYRCVSLIYGNICRQD